jgi:hypothetical protein
MVTNPEVPDGVTVKDILPEYYHLQNHFFQPIKGEY